ncbi:hypothetical protein QE152_g39222 [Popillia japonica]|uniref:Uncharacterized protein n=1 Tax=Popillia japonica TaxID=7064 RepID=A0AAW1HUP7_POPJA
MAESEVMRPITAGLLPYYRHMINISNPKNLGELDSLIDTISETEGVGNVYTSNTSQPPHLKPSDSHTSSISSMTTEITNLVLASVREEMNASTRENPNKRHQTAHPVNSFHRNSRQPCRTVTGCPLCFNCRRPGHIAAAGRQNQNQWRGPLNGDGQSR